MKKIFTLLSLAMVAFAAKAQTVEVVFHVDDPSHVKSMIFADQAYQFDYEGNLTVYATEYCQWTLSTFDPYVISAESDYTDYYSSGDVYTGTLYTQFASEYTSAIYVYDGCAYKTEYNIITADNSLVRPYSAQINIFGNPKKVKMSEYGFYTEHYFTESENTYHFMTEPYSENNINISAVEYGTNLYKVLLNGEAQTPEYGSYSISLADGDKVEIYTEWPDEEVTVSFELQGDACFKSFSEARINNQKITDFTQTYTAKMGQSINLYLSYYNYTTDLFTVNGEDQPFDEWGGSYTGVLTEDLHIVLKQTKKECNTATVKVDDYTRIKYSEAGLDLVPESNEFVIEIGKDKAQYNPITIYPFDYTCEIKSCKVDGVDAEYNSWSRCYSVNMEKDGQVVEVTTAALERPYMFSFYFNSPEQEVQDKYNLYGWDLSCQFPREDLTAEAIKPGYNFIDFSTELDGAFSFGTFGDVSNVNKYVYVYYENEKLAGSEGYGIVWPFTPADASALKVFYTDVEPSFYTATFAVENDAAVKGAYVDGLKGITVSDKAEYFELQETGFTLLLDDGYIVKLNGEQIDPMEEPVLARSEEGTVYYFNLVKDLSVEILKDESGINTIAADDNAADPAVYNILGVKVSNGSTDNLPAGLYIQKGQKFYVK